MVVVSRRISRPWRYEGSSSQRSPPPPPSVLGVACPSTALVHPRQFLQVSAADWHHHVGFGAAASNARHRRHDRPSASAAMSGSRLGVVWRAGKPSNILATASGIASSKPGGAASRRSVAERGAHQAAAAKRETQSATQYLASAQQRHHRRSPVQHLLH